jgi:hypothetical protein
VGLAGVCLVSSFLSIFTHQVSFITCGLLLISGVTPESTIAEEGLAQMGTSLDKLLANAATSL